MHAYQLVFTIANSSMKSDSTTGTYPAGWHQERPAQERGRELGNVQIRWSTNCIRGTSEASREDDQVVIHRMLCFYWDQHQECLRRTYQAEPHHQEQEEASWRESEALSCNVTHEERKCFSQYITIVNYPRKQFPSIGIYLYMHSCRGQHQDSRSRIGSWLLLGGQGQMEEQEAKEAPPKATLVGTRPGPSAIADCPDYRYKKCIKGTKKETSRKASVAEDASGFM